MSARGEERASGRLRVLQSFPSGRKSTNPYLIQLVDALPDDITVSGFSWRHALTASYDVFHVHWPEVLLRGTTRWKTAARRALFALLLTRLRLKHVPVVRTLHNEGAHEVGPWIEQGLLAWLDAQTGLWIRLNRNTTAPTDKPIRTIVHGDYRAWFSPFERAGTVPGRICYFGLIRPYKGVVELLDAFHDVDDAHLSLHVLGKPSTQDLENEVRATAARDDRVTVELDYVDDPRLHEEITAAELVVLPYREMHNSGALLLALSLDTPVLVPSTPTTEDLKQEVGPDWMLTYAGPLAPRTIEMAHEALREGPPSGRPDLSGRAWSLLGEAHAAAYREAITAAAG